MKSDLAGAIADKVNGTVAAFGHRDQERIEGLLNGTVTALVDLLCVHWKNIDDLLLEDDKGGAKFSLSVKLDMGEGEKTSKVTSKISYSKRTSDTVEIPVEKPIEMANV